MGVQVVAEEGAAAQQVDNLFATCGWQVRCTLFYVSLSVCSLSFLTLFSGTLCEVAIVLIRTFSVLHAYHLSVVACFLCLLSILWLVSPCLLSHLMTVALVSFRWACL